MIYVFRIAKGHEGGEPTNECPINMHIFEKNIKKMLIETEEELISYECNNYLDYLHKELWQCGKLRQGWGFEGLNLELYNTNPEEWIKNYIIGAKKYWGEKITENYCNIATGRFNILRNMFEAQAGDIIFIPKHSFDKHHDENFFTVCSVVGRYYFDLDERYQDFGHVVIVKNLKSYPYSKNTLLQGDFIGYRKALGQIKESHQLYNNGRFKKFMRENYGKSWDYSKYF